ncbi:hypothetical protein EW026_g439 [Hermanssonia centrifuga]|uniref:Uncharacterized protein n=1 Tax=Hermanssonia centrifuga TaxID=98765 RepID=A0A4S4KUH7_9APHY|nr:hypothetical protein EW026_g439 [Hermanssonia centrifuga]
MSDESSKAGSKPKRVDEEDAMEGGLKGRISAGAEFYLSAKEKSAGVSAGPPFYYSSGRNSAILPSCAIAYRRNNFEGPAFPTSDHYHGSIQPNAWTHICYESEWAVAVVADPLSPYVPAMTPPIEHHMDEEVLGVVKARASTTTVR